MTSSFDNLHHQSPSQSFSAAGGDCSKSYNQYSLGYITHLHRVHKYFFKQKLRNNNKYVCVSRFILVISYEKRFFKSNKHCQQFRRPSRIEISLKNFNIVCFMTEYIIYNRFAVRAL